MRESVLLAIAIIRQLAAAQTVARIAKAAAEKRYADYENVK